MTTGDRWIRGSAIAAVSLLALVAGAVSYRHSLQVVSQHGEAGLVGYAYPLTIDGLIYVSSMVLLDRARRGYGGHPLAYSALVLGIAATLAANIAAGLSYGVVGAIVAAWPAPALVISYELLMLVIRSGAAPDAAGTAGSEVPAWVAEAHAEFAGELAAGQLPSYRAIRSRLGVGADKGQQVRRYLETLPASSNGHGEAIKQSS